MQYCKCRCFLSWAIFSWDRFGSGADKVYWEMEKGWYDLGFECLFGENKWGWARPLSNSLLIFHMKPVSGAFKLPLHIKPKDTSGEHGYTVNGLSCQVDSCFHLCCSCSVISASGVSRAVTGRFSFLCILRKVAVPLLLTLSFVPKLMAGAPNVFTVVFEICSR